MAIKKFVDRKEELKFFEKKFKSDKFEFILLTGRRRIGKTRLIKEVIKDKEAIYLISSLRGSAYNLKKFSEKVCSFFNYPSLNFNSFFELFQFIVKQKENVIVVIDEFGYLIEKDKGIVSDFQEIIDELLIKTKIKLIFTGSYVSLMEKELLNYKSPLYGRTTGVLKLKPISFFYFKDFFPDVNLENKFKIFSICDGIPKYLEFFEGKNLEKEIIENFFNDTSFLFREAYQLLSEELRELTNYSLILEAISLGKNNVNEISNFTKIESKDLSFYLRVLQDLRIIKRITPFSLKKEKKGIYVFNDNYFFFWFYFISPYYSNIEAGFVKEAINNFKKNFNTYLGRTFEILVERILKEKNFLPFEPFKFGKWWWRDKEIDLVAFNEQERKIAFLECKWQELRISDVKRIVRELEEKIDYFYQKTKLNRNELREYLGIVAKEMNKKAKKWLKENGYLVYELKDFKGL